LSNAMGGQDQNDYVTKEYRRIPNYMYTCFASAHTGTDYVEKMHDDIIDNCNLTMQCAYLVPKRTLEIHTNCKLSIFRTSCNRVPVPDIDQLDILTLQHNLVKWHFEVEDLAGLTAIYFSSNQ